MSLLDLTLEWLYEGRTSHGLSLDNLIIQNVLNIIHGGQDVRTSLTIWQDVKLHLRSEIIIEVFLQNKTWLMDKVVK